MQNTKKENDRISKYVQKLRKEFLKIWNNPTEKQHEVECSGSEGAAAYFYELILAPMGW